jgi:hypothetical protein
MSSMDVVASLPSNGGAGEGFGAVDELAQITTEARRWAPTPPSDKLAAGAAAEGEEKNSTMARLEGLLARACAAVQVVGEPSLAFRE